MSETHVRNAFKMVIKKYGLAVPKAKVKEYLLDSVMDDILELVGDETFTYTSDFNKKRTTTKYDFGSLLD